MRSKDDMVSLHHRKELEEEEKKAIKYFDQLNKVVTPANLEVLKAEEGMSDKFKEACKNKNSGPTELPYIVGYKGFRRGVVSDNYYGKNFREVALTSVHRMHEAA